MSESPLGSPPLNEALRIFVAELVKSFDSPSFSKVLTTSATKVAAEPSLAKHLADNFGLLRFQ